MKIFKKSLSMLLVITMMLSLMTVVVFAETINLYDGLRKTLVNGTNYTIKGDAENVIITIPENYTGTITLETMSITNHETSGSAFVIGKNATVTMQMNTSGNSILTKSSAIELKDGAKLTVKDHKSSDANKGSLTITSTENITINNHQNSQLTVDSSLYLWAASAKDGTAVYKNPSKVTINSKKEINTANGTDNFTTDPWEVAELSKQIQAEKAANGSMPPLPSGTPGGGGGGGGGTCDPTGTDMKDTLYATTNYYYYDNACGTTIPLYSLPSLSETKNILVKENTNRTIYIGSTSNFVTLNNLTVQKGSNVQIFLTNTYIQTLEIAENANVTIVFDGAYSVFNSYIDSIESVGSPASFNNVYFWGINNTSPIQDFTARNTNVYFTKLSSYVDHGCRLYFEDLTLINSTLVQNHNMRTYVTNKLSADEKSKITISDGHFWSEKTKLDPKTKVNIDLTTYHSDGYNRHPNVGIMKNEDISTYTSPQVMVFPVVNNLSSDVNAVANIPIAFRIVGDGSTWLWTETDEKGQIYVPVNMANSPTKIEFIFADWYYDWYPEFATGTIFTREISHDVGNNYAYKKIYLVDPVINEVNFNQPTSNNVSNFPFEVWGLRIFGEFRISLVPEEYGPDLEQEKYHAIFTKNGERPQITKRMENTNAEPQIFNIYVSIDGNIIYTSPHQLILPGKTNSATDIIKFDIPGSLKTEISNVSGTVKIRVPYTMDVTNLTPTIMIPYGSTIDPASGVAQDFTNPVKYTVTASNGTTKKEYTVTVIKQESPEITTLTTTYPDSSGNIVVSFSGINLPNDIYMVATPNSGSTITTTNFRKNQSIYTTSITIPASVLNSDTDTIYSLKFFKTENDEEIKNSSETQNITISRKASTDAEITNFTMPDQVGTTDIDQDTKTITVTFPYDYQFGNKVVPNSIDHTGESIFPDESKEIVVSKHMPVKYTVIAESGNSTTYTVIFKPKGNPIIYTIDYTLELEKTGGTQVITVTGANFDNANTMSVKVSNGTDQYTSDLGRSGSTSASATFNIPANTTANYQTYFIEVSIDGAKHNFAVSPSFLVKPHLETEKNITNFNIPGQDSSNINGNTITVTMPYKIKNKVLTPDITIPATATIVPAKGIPVDFTNPVKYIVTSQSGEKNEYTVIVTSKESPMPNSVEFENPLPKGGDVSFKVNGTAFNNASNMSIILTPNNSSVDEIEENLTKNSNTLAKATAYIPVNDTGNTVSYTIKIKIDDIIYPIESTLTIDPAIYTDNFITSMQVENSVSIDIQQNTINVVLANTDSLRSQPTIVKTSLGSHLVNSQLTYDYSRNFTLTVEAQNGDTKTYTVRPSVDQTVRIGLATVEEQSNGYLVTVTGQNLHNLSYLDVILDNANDSITYETNSRTDTDGNTYYYVLIDDLENNTPNDIIYNVIVGTELGDVEFANVKIIVPTQLSDENDIIEFEVDGSDDVSIRNSTVTVKVPFYFNISNVAPTITVSNGATITPQSGEYRNFENVVQYVVTSASGETKAYNVTFVKEATPIFESLVFANPTYEGGDVIINLNGENLDSVNDLKLRVLDSSNNYTDYNFDGDEVTVNIPRNDSIQTRKYKLQIVADGQIFDMTEEIVILPQDDGGNKILTFELEDALNIELTENNINILLPYGYDLTNLRPTYTTSVGATLNDSLYGDYSSLNKTISLTSQTGETRTYTISVEVEDFDTISITNLSYLNTINPTGGNSNIEVTFNKNLYVSELKVVLDKNGTETEYELVKNGENHYSTSISFPENDTHHDEVYTFEIYVNNTKVEDIQYETENDKTITLKGHEPINLIVRNFVITGQANAEIDDTNKLITVTMPYNWIATSPNFVIENISFNVEDLNILNSEFPIELNEEIELPIYYKGRELIDTYSFIVTLELEPKLLSFTGPEEMDALGGNAEYELLVQNIDKDRFSSFLVFNSERVEGLIRENDTDDYSVIFNIPKNDTKNEKTYIIELYLDNELQGMETKTLKVLPGTEIEVTDFIVSNSRDIVINNNLHIISVLMPYDTDLTDIDYEIDLPSGLTYELITDEDFSNIVSFKVINEGGFYEVYSVITTLDLPDEPASITNFEYSINSNDKLDLIISTSNIKETDNVKLITYLNNEIIDEENIEISNNYALIQTEIPRFKENDSNNYSYKFEVYLNNNLEKTTGYNVMDKPTPEITDIIARPIDFDAGVATITIKGDNFDFIEDLIVKLQNEDTTINANLIEIVNGNYEISFNIPTNDTYDELEYDILITLNGEDISCSETLEVKGKEVPTVSFLITMPNQIKQETDSNMITITMPHNTDITKITPNITIPAQYTSSTPINVETDFSRIVEYTLTYDIFSFTYFVQVKLDNKPEVTKITFTQPDTNDPEEIIIKITGTNLDKAESIKIVAENDSKKLTAYAEEKNNKFTATIENIPANTSSSKKEYDIKVYVDGELQDISETLTIPKKKSSSGSSGGGGGGGGGGYIPSKPSQPVVTPPVVPTVPDVPEIPNIPNPTINVDAPYIAGYEDGSFLPQNNITRAEVATIISRLVPGYNPEITYTNNFADVDQNMWYANYIGFASSKGIINGAYGLYRPTDNITRAEFSAIIYRLLAETSVNTSKFPDVTGTFFEKEISTLTKKGIISGYEDGLFRPNNFITRAEAVKMINVAFGIKNKTITKTFKDVPTTFWAYEYINNAAN